MDLKRTWIQVFNYYYKLILLFSDNIAIYILCRPSAEKKYSSNFTEMINRAKYIQPKRNALLMFHLDQHGFKKNMDSSVQLLL